jgi:hypothetical protein
MNDKEVVSNLQNALEQFLAAHRKLAEADREWVRESSSMTAEDLESTPGCGCKDCMRAGELLGSI